MPSSQLTPAVSPGQPALRYPHLWAPWLLASELSDPACPPLLPPLSPALSVRDNDPLPPGQPPRQSLEGSPALVTPNSSSTPSVTCYTPLDPFVFLSTFSAALATVLGWALTGYSPGHVLLPILLTPGSLECLRSWVSVLLSLGLGLPLTLGTAGHMRPGRLSSLSEHCGGGEGGGSAQHLNKEEFLPPYSPCSSVGTESTCSEGNPGSIPGLGRSPGGGHGNPLQYSCLENAMDRGAWWVTVRGVAKSWTRLSDCTFTFK